MTIPEPHIQPDDTQPNTALREEISRSVLGNMPLWLLVTVIVMSSLSLLATIGLAFSRRSVPDEIIDSKQVILRVDGVQRDLVTLANTVNELLEQEAVVPGTNDLVFPDRETVLVDEMVVTVSRARTVTITFNGETTPIETPLDNPAEILQQAAIILRENDRVFVDGTLATGDDLANWPVPANEITVQRTYDLTILDNGESTTISTTEATVGDALFEANIDIFLTDTVTPNLETVIDRDLDITIERAKTVTINVDETALETRVQGNTIADALAEAGIALVGLDYTIPAMDSAIEPGMTINVLRVTESIETTDFEVPFQTTYQADASLELDQQQARQSGSVGIEQLSERVRFENGVEVSREPINTEIVTQPTNQVIAYGTNIVVRTVDTPEGSREYWRVIRAYATSYHPEALGGDNITAIGMELRKGIIAADPDIIPYRTNLYVPGYGTGLMADTGGTRSSPYWVDLGYSDEDFRGWSRYVDVYLLTPIPPDVDYLLPNFRPLRGRPDN